VSVPTRERERERERESMRASTSDSFLRCDELEEAERGRGREGMLRD
jgi:hypothetical protein